MTQLETLTFTDAETARVLMDKRTPTLLGAFMKGPRTLSDVAAEVEVKLPTLSYHVNRYLELCLMEVARYERRHGRNVKLYQSTAKSFAVPFYATPSETLEQLLLASTEPATKRFYREYARTLQRVTPAWGYYLECNEGRHISRSFKPDKTAEVNQAKTFTDWLSGPDEPALHANEGRIRLDFDTAKAFQRDLIDLYKRYETKQNPNGQIYGFRLGLTPLQDLSLE